MGLEVLRDVELGLVEGCVGGGGVVLKADVDCVDVCCCWWEGSGVARDGKGVVGWFPERIGSC